MMQKTGCFNASVCLLFLMLEKTSVTIVLMMTSNLSLLNACSKLQCVIYQRKHWCKTCKDSSYVLTQKH